MGFSRKWESRREVFTLGFPELVRDQERGSSTEGGESMRGKLPLVNHEWRVPDGEGKKRGRGREDEALTPKSCIAPLVIFNPFY